MLQPDPTACCPDAFYCPTAGETECLRHSGFTTCCVHHDRHVAMDRAAWNLAQEELERDWLNQVFKTKQIPEDWSPIEVW